jgi:hypothetical protein
MDTAAINEYPGDNGLGTTNPFFRFGDGSAPLKEGTADQVSLNGFIYVAGTLKCVGNQVILGMAWVSPDSATGGGNCAIYYRDDLAPLTAQVANTMKITSIQPVKTP